MAANEHSDIFDDVVFLEQKLHKDGYNEGFAKGQLIGEVEGFAMGVERGKSFGQEVGFYDGLVSSLAILYEDKNKPRLIKVLKQMQKKIEEIKKSEINPQDQKMFDQLEDLRSKFKQVTAMTNTTALYGQSTTEPEGMSF